MWTFDDVPAARIQRVVGVTIDRPWLDHLRRSAVRLTTGCSAAVVSRRGLALTNQHCVLACAQGVSGAAGDALAEGFAADTLAAERRCPGMQAEVLVGVIDVSGPVFAAGAGKAGAAFVAAREEALSSAEARVCRGDGRLRCQVIGFFAGGQFKVYEFRRYDDVRLVFAPEFGVAFFGGDPDNFTFPRFDLDFAFLRLYDAGAPARTPTHLAWSARPPAAGEAVFMAGNPAASERGLSVSQLEALRDVELPLIGAERAELRGRLIAFSEASPENRRIAAAALFEAENAFKVVRQRAAALADPAFMAARRRDEAALKASLAADPRLAAELGDPWTDLEALREVQADQFIVWRQLENAAGGGSRLYAWARGLVRAAYERTRPSPTRLPEFADSRLPLLEKTLLDDTPAPAPLERLYLEFWLSKTREWLGADAPATAIMLGGQSPEALAARLGASALGDPARRRALWAGGVAAIEASDDPMIAYVRRTDPVSRAARRLWEDRVTGPSERAAEGILRARIAARPGEIYPDATFSPRLSWGVVAGVDASGGTGGAFTTLGGLYARATGAEPYRLPPRWLAARDRLDPATVLDFSTTNDIVGGNSGSPVVDGKGEIIGAAFDGNLASIVGDFAYDGARDRAIAVSTAAIGEALAKTYRRPGLLKELEER